MNSPTIGLLDQASLQLQSALQAVLFTTSCVGASLMAPVPMNITLPNSNMTVAPDTPLNGTSVPLGNGNLTVPLNITLPSNTTNNANLASYYPTGGDSAPSSIILASSAIDTPYDSAPSSIVAAAASSSIDSAPTSTVAALDTAVDSAPSSTVAYVAAPTDAPYYPSDAPSITAPVDANDTPAPAAVNVPKIPWGWKGYGGAYSGW
jgi:hypothetical protein